MLLKAKDRAIPDSRARELRQHAIEEDRGIVDSCIS